MAGLVMTILVSPLPPVHISWKLKSTYKTALAKFRNQIKFSTANINRYNKDAKRKATAQSCSELAFLLYCYTSIKDNDTV